jgi:predicted ATPase
MPNYFIQSIHFKNILSFVDFDLSDLRRINIFIGGNSSGKSNIIRAIIGFAHDEDEKTSKRCICFADGTIINQPLNDSKYRDHFFEIPPFRNLIIPEGCALNWINWRSGIIDLSKLEEDEEKFYEDLEKIIGIEGFRLHGCAGVPAISYQNGRINAEQWTDWGWYNRKVNDQNKEITIDNLGWGTKSAITIFYNLFFNKEAIVFIEEPEISMHPELLKRLFIWAFRERPGCQFFITTHSSMLIDKIFLGLETKELSFYEIYSEKGISHRRPLNDKLDRIRLLEQMGFQSSNLLFANYVIWVEGPSDIFYYEALLNIMDKINNNNGIKRRVHYELMWYGGKQVKNVIDIESKDGLNLLFSFGRKGAIFWDYDDNKTYAEALASSIDEVKKTIKGNSEFSFDFCFGITGKMMRNNDGGQLSTDIHPRTIENLMSKKFAELALQKVFPGTPREKLAEIANAFENNDELEDNQKNKLNSKKKAMGIAFLDLINVRLEYDRPEDVFSSAIASKRCETIFAFFDQLYQNILNANRVNE